MLLQALSPAPDCVRALRLCHLVAPRVLEFFTRSCAFSQQTRTKHKPEGICQTCFGTKTRNITCLFCPHSTGQNLVPQPTYLPGMSGSQSIWMPSKKSKWDVVNTQEPPLPISFHGDRSWWAHPWCSLGVTP